jgi:anaerobic ribonucleoside-triphosphate reductase activating protein
MLIATSLFSRSTVIDGPGTRFILWVHGCPHHCHGCANRFLQKPRTPTVPASRLIDLVAQTPGIEGLTLCGGEPFEQAEALTEVAAGVHALGLSVVAFSGYLLEELKNVPHADRLLTEVDILLAGRFEKDHPERKRHWVGSTNKQVHYLSDRYQPGLEYPAEGERVRGPHKGPFSRCENIAP